MKIDNFFAELKRRNVIRMAGLYLVGAWLLVQVAGTVLPMFGAPDWLPRSIVILLAIGFVPVLVFSWAFELTPSGLKRDEEVKPEESIAPQTAHRMNRMIIAVLVLALGYFAFDKIVLAPRRDAALVAAAEKSFAARPATESNAKSVAVLPFADMSQGKDQRYFADGISEELLNALVRVEGIRVASRTSSFAYKESELGTAAIASALKVGYLVEGSVRKSGDRVRITAQLIDAINDRHLFSETYDRELADIFAIQGEIANAVVRALRGALGNDSRIGSAKVRADTDNLEAYDLYLKARELFIARENLKESIRLSERAVELDPNFARGWEMLGAVYAVAAPWGIRDRDYLPLSNRAAQRSLELDPSLSMPWAVLGNNLQLRPPVNWEQGFEFFAKATAADPKNATAYLWSGIGWVNLGFFDRAIADLDKALAIDPAYRNSVRWKAQALLYKGDTAQALTLFEKGLAEGFVVNRAHSFIGPLLQSGNRMAATLVMDHLVKKPALRETLLNALEKPACPNPDLESIVKQCEAEQALITHMGKTGVYLWLGAYDQVATADDNDAELAVAWEPFPPSFRNSAGCKRTLERLGVVAYWRKHGFPPQCRPVGEADFTCK
jgi:adenylate cyclase